MPGRAGTVRFGINPDEHIGTTSADGVSKVNTPTDGPYTETHYAFNPGRLSRDMGSTRGSDPQGDYVRVPRQADYMSNHDDYSAGDLHLLNMDEYKVLDNTVYSVKCEYAGDSPNGGAPSMTTGAFD